MAIISIGLAVSTAASALKADTSGNTVSLTVPYSAGGETMLVVVKAGGNINNNDDIYAVKLVSPDSKGNIDIDLNMPDSRINAPQKYDVYIKNGTSAQSAGKFSYATEGIKLSFLGYLNGAVDSSTELVEFVKPDPAQVNTAGYTLEETSIVLESMGVDTDTFYALPDMSTAANMMVSSAGGNFANVGEAAKCMNLSVAATAINSLQNAASTLEKCGFAFEGEKYEDITDTNKKAWIDSYINTNRGYTTANGLEMAYETANQLYVINNTRFDVMESTLAGYAASMGLNTMNGYKAYLALTSKTDANDRLAGALKLSPVNTVQALDTAIGLAVSGGTTSGGPVLGPSIAPGTGTGEGGAVGGGGANLAGVNGMVPVITPALDTEKDKPIFNDMAGAEWAIEAIEKLVSAGIVAGDENGNFRPHDYMTREEYVKMIVCAVNMHNKNAQCSFLDVPEDAWYYSYVASAYMNELVAGKTGTEFGVGSPLTRQDMVVIAARAAEKVRKMEPIREAVKFADDDLISEYAKAYVEKLYCMGVVNGVDSRNFDPLGYATRAQGALVIYNLFLN